MGIADVAAEAAGAVVGQASATSDWSQLPPASINGVEFPLGPSSKRGGAHRYANHVYPGRPLKATEGQGKSPRVWELEIPLWASVNPDHYPGVKVKLENAWGETGRVQYIDPEEGGPIACRVIPDPVWRRDPLRPNGGIYYVTLEEHFEDFDEMITALVDARGLAEANAAAVDAGLENAGISEGDLLDGFADSGVGFDEPFDDGTLTTSMVEDFFDTLQEAENFIDATTQELEQLRARIDVIHDAMLQLDEATQLENWEVFQALIGVAEACGVVAEKQYGRGPAIVEWEVPARMSSVQIASQLYGDPYRAAEIEEMNPTRNVNFYAKGSVLLVYES